MKCCPIHKWNIADCDVKHTNRNTCAEYSIIRYLAKDQLNLCYRCAFLNHKTTLSCVDLHHHFNHNISNEDLLQIWYSKQINAHIYYQSFNYQEFPRGLPTAPSSRHHVILRIPFSLIALPIEWNNNFFISINRCWYDICSPSPMYHTRWKCISY